MDAPKEGSVISQHIIRNERVVFRYPKWTDFRDYMALENALHAENAFLPHQVVTERMACERLGKILADLETGRASHIFVEAAGRVVGRGSVETSHGFKVGTVGIAIIGEYQGRGIGSRMMQLLDKEGAKLGFRRLYLDVWAANTIAQKLYKKSGYVEVGRRPDWIARDDLPGGMTDLIEMMKKI